MKKQKRFDETKPCSWCNVCPSSFCSCGECSDLNCKICYSGFKEPQELPFIQEWDDADSEGAGGDR